MSELNGSVVNEQNYQKVKGKIKTIAKVLLIVGLILLVVGIVLIIVGANQTVETVSSSGSGSGSFSMGGTVRATTKNFGLIGGGAIMVFVGIAMAAYGLVATLIAHQREVAAFAAGSTMPVVKDVAEYSADNIAPAVGKGLGSITSGIAGGIASGIKQAKEATKPTCPNCGSTVEAGDEFCSNCGKPIKQTKTCPKCGATVADSKKFCPKCGEKL